MHYRRGLSTKEDIAIATSMDVLAHKKPNDLRASDLSAAELQAMRVLLDQEESFM